MITDNFWTHNGDILDSMLDLRDVAAAYGLHIDRNGFASCPFHSERTASFSIPQRGKFGHCFGCGANADVVKLTMQLCGCRYSEAVRTLNRDFGCGLKLDRPPTYRERAKAQREMAERQRAERGRERLSAEWEERYFALLAEFERYDSDRREYRPRQPCEELHPRFAEALHRIEVLKYQLLVFPTCEEYMRLRGGSRVG